MSKDERIKLARTIIETAFSGSTEPFSRRTVERFVIFKWPVGVTAPSVAELSMCLSRMIRDGFLERRRPSTAGPGWVEPHYRVAVKRAPPLPFMPYPAVPKVFRGSHECGRCRMKIQGKGRHGKSRRGHGKAECDLEMVKHYMIL